MKQGVGKLRHQIEIIQLVTSEDSNYGGENVTSESTLATVWASWEPKETGSGEDVISDQKDASNTINFRIRYRNDVKSTMLVKYENVYYNILSVIPDTKRIYTLLETEFLGDSWSKT